MSFIQNVFKNIDFLVKCYQNQESIRPVLESENFYRNRDTIVSLLELENLRFLSMVAPGHFYSPLPDPRAIESKAESIFNRSIKEIPAIDLNESAQVQLVRSFAKNYPEMPFSEHKSDGKRYFFENNYYSYGDGIILYSFLRHFRPKRIVEVGSGFSSAAMLDVNELFLNREIDLTFIEPLPDRLFDLLSDEDRKKVRIEVKPVQEIEIDLFSSLEENDILFIDSSHIGKIDSDVVQILFQILPRLPKGVIVHIHDILWPFEYLEIWLEMGLAWNEAYFVRAFLQYNPAFEILYFNSYMALHQTDLLRELMPLVLKDPSDKRTPGNTSLWLRKVL